MNRLKDILKIKGASWVILVFLFIIIGSVFTVNRVFSSDTTTAISKLSPDAAKAVTWAFISAAVSVSIGSLSAAIALAYIGAAAMGAISEKPEVAGKAIIFAGLAEGVAIYGLIIAIMILTKV